MQTEQFQLHAEIEERHWWFVARRRILKDVVHAVLPPSSQSTIVDVGCGTGANLAALADDYTCVGIDASAEAVRLAHQRFAHVRFVCGQAAEMPSILADARLVLLTDVLEHVADDSYLLSSLLAAMSPGAYLLATVPAEPALWSEHDRAFGHYRRYEAEQFEQLWQELAVTPIFMSPFNARLYPLIRAVRRWNRLRGKAAGRAGTDFVLPAALSNRILTSVFAGERRKLARLAAGAGGAPYRYGVSLMALLRREAGAIRPRRAPCDVVADVVDSEAVSAAV